MTKDDAVPVTAEAREAAADLLNEVSSLLGDDGIGQVADLIRDGEYDEHDATLAFARFERDILARHRGSTAGVEPCGVCGHGLTTQIGASLQAKADGAAEWMRRAAAAEIGVIQAREALQKIATGKIDGEPNNAKDTLGIVRQIATEALASLSQTPATPMVQEGLREALAIGEKFLNACFSAWACGEPHHRVKTMMDRADEFRAALDALSATPAQPVDETERLKADPDLERHIFEWFNDLDCDEMRACLEAYDAKRADRTQEGEVRP